MTENDFMALVPGIVGVIAALIGVILMPAQKDDCNTLSKKEGGESESSQKRSVPATLL